MPKILLVEDDRLFAQLVADSLTSDKHTVEMVHDGEEALAFLKTYQYELLILDWELPGMTGISICREFRRAGGETPVLFLTGRKDLDDKADGFSSGADDYLTKPFEMKELLLRVQALLRRPGRLLPETITAGALSLDLQNGKVTLEGNEVKLQPQEFALLVFLMRHQRELFSPEALLDRVWLAESEATPQALRSCVTKLRRKIDLPDRESLIENVHGRGYRFEAR